MAISRYVHGTDNSTCPPRRKSDEVTERVVITKEEIIDALKTLEGVKRKLQAALKRS